MGQILDESMRQGSGRLERSGLPQLGATLKEVLSRADGAIRGVRLIARQHEPSIDHEEGCDQAKLVVGAGEKFKHVQLE